MRTQADGACIRARSMAANDTPRSGLEASVIDGEPMTLQSDESVAADFDVTAMSFRVNEVRATAEFDSPGTGKLLTTECRLRLSLLKQCSCLEAKLSREEVGEVVAEENLSASFLRRWLSIPPANGIPVGAVYTIRCNHALDGHVLIRVSKPSADGHTIGIQVQVLDRSSLEAYETELTSLVDEFLAMRGEC